MQTTLAIEDDPQDQEPIAIATSELEKRPAPGLGRGSIYIWPRTSMPR